MIVHLFTTWFTEYFKPTIELIPQKKRFLSKILLIDNAPVHPSALMKMYSEINVVFMPANTTSSLQHTDQGVILTFKSYKASIGSDSTDGPEQSPLETLWKGVAILKVIKNIRDSWEKVETSALTGIWKKLIPTLKDD